APRRVDPTTGARVGAKRSSTAAKAAAAKLPLSPAGGVPPGADMRARPVNRDLAIGAVRRPGVGTGIAMKIIPVIVPLRDVAGREIGIIRLGERRRGGDEQ